MNRGEREVFELEGVDFAVEEFFVGAEEGAGDWQEAEVLAVTELFGEEEAVWAGADDEDFGLDSVVFELDFVAVGGLGDFFGFFVEVLRGSFGVGDEMLCEVSVIDGVAFFAQESEDWGFWIAFFEDVGFDFGDVFAVDFLKFWIVGVEFFVAGFKFGDLATADGEDHFFWFFEKVFGLRTIAFEKIFNKSGCFIYFEGFFEGVVGFDVAEVESLAIVFGGGIDEAGFGIFFDQRETGDFGVFTQSVEQSRADDAGANYCDIVVFHAAILW